MFSRAFFSRRFLYLRLLAATLVAGAVLDVALAACLFWAPEVGARLLDLPLPGETFYLWLLAAFLLVLAALYLIAAADPRRYSGVIAVAISGRLLIAALLAAAAVGRADLAALRWLAACDLALGLGHAAFWLPVRS